MNTFENKENIVSPVDLHLQKLSENIVGNMETITFSQNLSEDNNNKLNNIFAKFLIPQNQLETA